MQLTRDKEENDTSNLKVLIWPRWSTNPYQNLLAEHLEKLGVQVEEAEDLESLNTAIRQSKPDILHLHALYPFFLSSGRLSSVSKWVRSCTQLLIWKLMGIKIVWTAHNLKNHQNRYLVLDRIFRTLVAKLAYGVVAHSETAKQQVAKAFHLKNIDKIFVVPHGNYLDCYENSTIRAVARKTLEIPDPSVVLLFLGAIRSYKGVPNLIDVFKQVNQDDVQLVIAGKPSNDRVGQQIKEQIAGKDNIKFIPGFVADDQIQVYMNACDVVVMPYRDILTSGSAVLAMSFGRACIAPRKGCIGDLLDDSGAFLYDPDQEEGLSQVLNCALQNRAELQSMGEHNYRLAQHWSWNRVAEMTLNVYQLCFSR